MYEYKTKLLRVVDGDTVDIDIDLGFGVWLRNQRVRVYGIDTPEVRTRDLKEKEHGKLATQFVIDHLGDTPTLLSKGIEGKFGRILGDFTVFDSKHDRWSTLTECLVEAKLAVPYHGQSKDEIEEQHLVNRRALGIIE